MAASQDMVIVRRLLTVVEEVVEPVALPLVMLSALRGNAALLLYVPYFLLWYSVMVHSKNIAPNAVLNRILKVIRDTAGPQKTIAKIRIANGNLGPVIQVIHQLGQQH